MEQQQSSLLEIKAQHEAAQLELSRELDREAQYEESELLHKMKENKHKLLKEKESKLNAKVDAVAISDEDRKRVGLMFSWFIVTNIIILSVDNRSTCNRAL